MKNMYPELFVFTKSLIKYVVKVAIEIVPTQSEKREKNCAKLHFGKNRSPIPKSNDLNMSACSLSEAKPSTR